MGLRPRCLSLDECFAACCVMVLSQIERMFKAVDVDNSGLVDVIDWLDYVEPLRVRAAGSPVVQFRALIAGSCALNLQLSFVPVSDPRWSLLLAPESKTVMSEVHAQQFSAMLRRLDLLASAARDCAYLLKDAFPVEHVCNTVDVGCGLCSGRDADG